MPTLSHTVLLRNVVVLCFFFRPAGAQLQTAFRASYALKQFMEAAASVAECANPECSARFEKFGLGQLFVFPIPDPVEWALPEHAKQKVVWLCPGCCQHLQIRLNRRKHNVQLV